MRLDKQQKAKFTRHNGRIDSRETWGFESPRKSDLRAMLREAVENTAKAEVKEEN